MCCGATLRVESLLQATVLSSDTAKKAMRDATGKPVEDLSDKYSKLKGPLGICLPKRRLHLEVLHTDVLLVGFDHERQCPNSCPIC